MAAHPSPAGAPRGRRRAIRPAVLSVFPSLVGAVLAFLYFNYVDPLQAPLPGQRYQPLFTYRPLLVFLAVTVTLVSANVLVTVRWLGPLETWRRRLEAGADPAGVPADIRSRVLNAPLASAVINMTGWVIAGLFYLPYLMWLVGMSAGESWRNFIGLVFVAGPLTSALAFLLGELYWRRRVPAFFPHGRLQHTGVLRVPILARLAGTFLVTAVVPMLLMLMVDLSLERRFGSGLPAAIHPLWTNLLRVQVFIVAVSIAASVAMVLLVTRFINRPVQALRTAVVRVATGDLDVQVPVRSTDELGELNEHFNAMVEELRQAERTRDFFGRYVSPAVARQALERGIAPGGEPVHATAMFVDLRGFTALTQRTSPARVVEVLNEYYAIVERVCEGEGGVIMQFLGDGVVVVFGGPLNPVPDHASRAVRAAIALQRAFAERNRGGVEPRLEAGIGICTGDMIAGNVGAGGRVTYTIVGDAVNQAARLQVKTREIGYSILLTESTRAALGTADGVPLRPCGAVPLKGISAPVEVYAVDV